MQLFFLEGGACLALHPLKAEENGVARKGGQRFGTWKESQRKPTAQGVLQDREAWAEGRKTKYNQHRGRDTAPENPLTGTNGP